MFDIGFWEILMIAVVALVVVGPERMPRLIKVTGLWIGRANASIQSVRSDISRELRAEELRTSISDKLSEISEPEETIERYVFSDNPDEKPRHVEAESVEDAVVGINEDTIDDAFEDKNSDFLEPAKDSTINKDNHG